jgi:SAM-dependent methyltransferase
MGTANGPVLPAPLSRAEDGIRTRDPHLGKVMRYRCATSALGNYIIAAADWEKRRGSRLPPASSSARSVRVTCPLGLGSLPCVDQDETTAVLSRSFGAVADDYNRLRPGPSGEALDWLIPEGATDVLEIGAGTGLLTRLLAQRVAHVTAVEPDGRMRAVLAEGDAGVEVLAGQAEELPAATSSYDLVIAASAWHWVDEQRAVPEVARVLRTGGRLSLVWSGPDRSVDWMRSLWAGGIIFNPEEQADVDARRRHRHRVNVDCGGPSPFHEPETALFRWSRPMTRADLVALATTYSSVITMDESTRRQHLDAMARFLESRVEFAGTDVIDVPMRSYCWRATKR